MPSRIMHVDSEFRQLCENIQNQIKLTIDKDIDLVEVTRLFARMHSRIVLFTKSKQRKRSTVLDTYGYI